MSITAETAKAHAHDPAVLCCRAEAGITIEAANLEDPAIFDDLVESGLLNLDGCVKRIFYGFQIIGIASPSHICVITEQ